MALSYNTYFAIPQLLTYAEAKAHYDSVKPIRGDAHGTRPAGTRKQKWFSIWMDGTTVRVGYGTGDDANRTPIVSYDSNGTITIHKRNRWSSASDNERRERLLGTDVKTHQYDTWVRCAWFDGGVERDGWLPLRCNGQRGWGPDIKPEESVFVRNAKGRLVYLNYSYPKTHKPNKVRMKEAIEPYQPFIRFVEGIRKLQDGRLGFSNETKSEYLGWVEKQDWEGNTLRVPKMVLSTNWGEGKSAARREFFAWAVSEDHDDWMRAAISLAGNADHGILHGKNPALAFIKDLLLKVNGSELMEVETHTGGKLVTDRYKRYLRDA